MIVNYSTGSRLTPAFVDLIVAHSRDNSTEEAFGAYLPSWARADLLARVKGNEVPVKVITGEYDPTQPAEFMEQAWLQVYPNSSWRSCAAPATTRCSRRRPLSRSPSRSSSPRLSRTRKSKSVSFRTSAAGTFTARRAP